MHILLVEDDHKAARLLARGLEEEGFRVQVAHGAHEAATPAGFDLAILDWMMPGKDGVTLCAEWRQSGHQLPVLMLTARDAVADRILGLNTGADDYLTKPFVFDELLARVRALLRRFDRAQPALLKVADLALDARTRTATRGGSSFIKPLSTTRSGFHCWICSSRASPHASRSSKLERATEKVGMP